jgi:putative transposase
MLRSYTRAINKQENTSGSLFRQQSKAICLTCHKGITPLIEKEMLGKTININNNSNYPQHCFKYIHDNPVKAGLVENAIDWQFSSARDYFGSREGSLINKKVAEMFNLMNS